MCCAKFLAGLGSRAFLLGRLMLPGEFTLIFEILPTPIQCTMLVVVCFTVKQNIAVFKEEEENLLTPPCD